MPHFDFYYDETEHSRKIGHSTISAENYYDSFAAFIIGLSANNKAEIEDKYLAFEKAFEHRKSNGELKSTTLRQAQFRYGLASLNKNNIKFIHDLLSVYDGTIIYATVISKIEFLVRQIFIDYRNSIIVDADAVRYTITKALLTYRPADVADCIYNRPKDTIKTLKSFFEKQIEINKTKMPLKERENQAFREVLLLLDDVHGIERLEWDYSIAFEGFQLFLREMGIDDYSLTIDNEKKTFETAQSLGFDNASEGDSKQFVGIRMADMLAGITAKLMKALSEALTPKLDNDGSKTILEKEWFSLTDEQLQLYHQLKKILIDQNNCWYKIYAGNYADDLVCLIALLNFMASFETPDDLKRSIDDCGGNFNSYTCKCLEDHHQRMRNKLPIDPITPSEREREYFLNQRGAKVYWDLEKQPILPIGSNGTKYTVFSVSVDRSGIPLVTVDFKGKAICYRIPIGLSEWAETVVGFAVAGEKLFPTDVIFTERNGRYFADIL